MLPGAVVTMGATALGFLIGWNGDAVGWGSLLGGGVALLLTLPLPALGAVIGYELGLESAPPPQVALIPVKGGMLAALFMRF